MKVLIGIFILLAALISCDSNSELDDSNNVSDINMDHIYNLVEKDISVIKFEDSFYRDVSEVGYLDDLDLSPVEKIGEIQYQYENEEWKNNMATDYSAGTEIYLPKEHLNKVIRWDREHIADIILIYNNDQYIPHMNTHYETQEN
ncbi:hypothetical protein [Alkalibacillus haloalkaliphilus]|uniref:Lipoprotein n=1 Tax=Alkalibacillus haloalkaliphilus TaxID=94136 RepID=A0A511W3N9_9BACI|nr:hypothetical protein [Alkalibacillus haloalkaliphilus]GEN45716.1 hypothetical protein AHA02nite_14920 [Alkalibacillus haloalkaliphilus]